METRKLFLYTFLGLTLYFILQAWQHDYGSTPETNLPSNSQGLPDLTQTSQEEKTPLASLPQNKVKATSSPTIDIKTDVLNLTIDLNQGEVIKAFLTQYPVSIKDNNPI